LDHLHDFQLEAVVECSAFVGHENLLDRCIFHLSRCPGKLDHYTATPLPLANTSPCRVCRGLSPPSHQRGHHSQAGCASRATRHAWRTKKKPTVFTVGFGVLSLSA
ncbi:hypothetical protein EYC95_26580, partial [Pseudomonas sp. BGI-2]